ncbi:MAG TPA: sigma-70 family RNA polymerase sigma factor [Kofleriaceae bacterium]|nr:sigma-70 family RNA polymerase sigma factor [Kofleriaceae bacterium]
MAEARTGQDAEAGRDPAPELDELTLRRAQRGEPAACRALVERYERPVFALLHRMLGVRHRHRVEDIAQETFLGVFRSLSGFAPLGPARLSTWILTIATRRAIDELRRAEAAGGEPAVLRDEDAVGTSRADEGARRAALGARVAAAVGALPADFRAAFLLREVHGLEYAEIARALEVDLGTVKSRLSRARAALREALADLEEERDGD